LATRRGAVAIVCLLLTAAACSSTNRARDTVADAGQQAGLSSAAPSGGRATSSSAPGTTSRRTGGTGATVAAPGDVGGGTAVAAPGERVTSPIKIGFVRTKVSNADEFGFDVREIQTISETKIVSAVVDAYNDKGGVAGRKIVPVYADTDTASNRWDVDFAEACAKFTQDNHVAAVLGYVFDFQEVLEDCLKKNGILHLSTTFNVPDAEVMSRYPNLFALAVPRIERRSIAKIDGAIATGVLKKSSRFGVLYDKCPYTVRSWEKNVLPYIKRKGLTLAGGESFICAKGASDNSQAIREIQNAILRFRTADVDTVMIHGVSEFPPLLLFSTEAESQGWRPSYIVSSLFQAAVAQGQLPQSQARNVHGYGWLPSQDVVPDKWPPMTDSAKRCVQMVKDKGVQPTTAIDYSLVFSTCESLFVYERVLKATAGHDQLSAVVPKVEGIGTTFQSTINLDGRSVITHAVRDAPARYRYFAWNDNCDCYTYRGGSTPIP
jgi:ABC-type branched-subunit amino acid transport system substrate-binding protein